MMNLKCILSTYHKIIIKKYMQSAIMPQFRSD